MEEKNKDRVRLSDPVEVKLRQSSQDEQASDQAKLIDHTEITTDDLSSAACDVSSTVVGQSLLDGRYQFIEHIGQGAMGVVHKALDTATGSFVAIKELNADVANDDVAMKRFEHEMDSLAKLNHERVVSVYSHGISEKEAPYLVMPYLGNQTLADLLEKEGPLEEARAIRIFVQICEGLSYAHGQGIIHRDVKPSNIIVDSSNPDIDIVHVVDFGIAKIVESTTSNTMSLTKTGEVFGTPTYMSPEQFQGTDLDKRTDIYSLGCLMYEALTGQPPFQSINPIQVAVKHLNEEPAPIEKPVSESLSKVTLECLRKDLNERYKSIDDLLSDLKAVQARKTPHLAAEGSLKRTKEKARKLSNPAMMALVLSLVYGCAFVENITIANSLDGLNLDPISSGLLGCINLLLFVAISIELRTALKNNTDRIDFADKMAIAWAVMLILMYGISAVLFLVPIGQPVADLLSPVMVLSLIGAGVGSILFLVYGLLQESRWSRSLVLPLGFLIFGCALFAVPDFVPFAGSHSANIHAQLLADRAPQSAKLLAAYSNVIKPSNTDGYVIRAKIMAHKEKQPEKALEVLNQAIRSSDKPWDAYLERGIVYHRLGEDSKAIDDLSRVVNSNEWLPKRQDFGAAYSARGEVYFDMKNYRAALADYNLAISDTKKENAALYLKRGFTHAALGDYEHAAIDFLSAEQVEKCANSETFRYTLNLLNFRLTDQERNAAVDCLRRAVAYELDGKKEMSRDLFSSVLKQLGSDSGSGSKWAETGPDFLMVAYAQSKLGNSARSDEAMKKASKLGFKKDQLKDILFKDVPAINLNW
ncbi:MAG: protein kinase [Candidatus Melainabacteria bacterium]|nr:protein kinase [Candidatus Melainabacteria bacterium]